MSKRRGVSAPTVRNRLITSTIDLIRRNGVSGTGIGELVAHADVARRSIYVNFPGGKSQLVTEATTVAGRNIADAIAALGDSTPAQAIMTFVQYWQDNLAATDYTAGCPIAAAALAHSESPEATEAAGQVFAEWERILTGRLQAAGIASGAAADLATAVVAGVEGALIMCIAVRDTAPLQRVGRALVSLVAAATASASA